MSDIMNGGIGHQLMSSLAHTIAKTTRSLISPSIDRFPVPYRRSILINMVIVHDREHAFTAQQEREYVCTITISALLLMTHARSCG
jgi:hypothetical protein